MPPATAFAFTSSRTPGSTGTAATSSTASTPDAAAIWPRWPTVAAGGGDLAGSGEDLFELADRSSWLFQLLDEPAEHLDVATADALTADLLAATEGTATLLVTHRLAGLEAADEIIVLAGGRVADRGTHAELLNRPGPYRALWRLERAPLTAA